MFAQKRSADDRVIALVGNPNVGKSTLFNLLTGLNQHTGNWPGKTVSVAQGAYFYKGREYVLVDLPGTYSLVSSSEEERITVEYLLSEDIDCTLIVLDGTCLERNLNLVLQVLETTDRAIVCVNLMDEVERRDIRLDLKRLEGLIGIPVVGISAGTGKGLDQLRENLRNLSDGFLQCTPKRMLQSREDILICDGERSAAFDKRAEEISKAVVVSASGTHSEKLDRVILGKYSGGILMLLLLFAIFWLTIRGANYPSALLQYIFNRGYYLLSSVMVILPGWIGGLLLDGVYATVTRVIAVMLPPMLIFFPLFTVLEDLGYLPRVAFLMDGSFQKCGGCGKQALTMAMGLGCNAVGVTGCRIIESPQERLLAIITNSLMPCNGRFPTMIVLIGAFFSNNGFLGAVILTGAVCLCVLMTFIVSFLINRSVLRNRNDCFILELPPYRKPQIKTIIVRSILDRSVNVLIRAVCVAAPSGVLIWLLQQISYQNTTLLQIIANYLQPIGLFLGMNGTILLAFILSFPANELLLPLIAMISQGGYLQDVLTPVLHELIGQDVLCGKTVVCMMIFLLFHWPCGTTCLTIRKETGSALWTAVAILLPAILGVLLCRFANWLI